MGLAQQKLVVGAADIAEAFEQAHDRAPHTLVCTFKRASARFGLGQALLLRLAEGVDRDARRVGQAALLLERLNLPIRRRRQEVVLLVELQQCFRGRLREIDDLLRGLGHA